MKTTDKNFKLNKNRDKEQVAMAIFTLKKLASPDGEHFSDSERINRFIKEVEKLQPLASIVEDTENETAEKMDEIVNKYFKNVLNLPCPDFIYNYKKNGFN